MRVAKAQQELTQFYCDGIDKNQSGKKKLKELREKYEIPNGVYLFEAASGGSAFTRNSVGNLKPFFSNWVKGKLTEEQCNQVYWYFEEIREADWGWIMLERPLGYYDAPIDDDQEAIRLEMLSIGTRSRSKNTKLQPLFSFS
jgi:hypothetical protein